MLLYNGPQSCKDRAEWFAAADVYHGARKRLEASDVLRQLLLGILSDAGWVDNDQRGSGSRRHLRDVAKRLISGLWIWAREFNLAYALARSCLQQRAERDSSGKVPIPREAQNNSQNNGRSIEEHLTQGQPVKALQKCLTIIAVFCVVSGWVLVSNPPRQLDAFSRTSHIDFTRRELWIGMFLLGSGISYFALKLTDRA
jgi:hypothetical protein